MPIINCPTCSEPYPLYLFAFGIPYWCGCGAIVGAPTEEPPASGPFRPDRSDQNAPPPDQGNRTPTEPSESARPDPGAGRAAPTASRPSEIDLSAAEWKDLQAELNARSARTRPEFSWPHPFDLRFCLELDEQRKAKEIQRRADRICYLISATSHSRREIELEERQLRDRCELYFPEIEGAYERVYARRFDYLWSQFRSG